VAIRARVRRLFGLGVFELRHGLDRTSRSARKGVMMNEKPEVLNLSLRQMIRTRLAAGSLFPVEGKVFAGKGTGQLCTVCGMPIFATEVDSSTQME
jgi:hypothetical protein